MHALKVEPSRRGPGLRLILLYWLVRAGGICYAVWIVRTNPGLAPKAMPYVEFCGPFPRIIHPGAQWCLPFGPLFALLDIGIGAGLVLYLRWALTLAMLDRIIPAIKYIVLLPIGYGSFGEKGMSAIIHRSPLKNADILMSLFMGDSLCGHT
jgi:hypothetical protein